MSKERIAVIVRTALLFVALLNQLLLVFGYTVLPVSEETLGELVSTVLTVGAALWAWWKDNSFYNG